MITFMGVLSVWLLCTYMSGVSALTNTLPMIYVIGENRENFGAWRIFSLIFFSGQTNYSHRISWQGIKPFFFTTLRESSLKVKNLSPDEHFLRNFFPDNVPMRKGNLFCIVKWKFDLKVSFSMKNKVMYK